MPRGAEHGRVSPRPVGLLMSRGGSPTAHAAELIVREGVGMPPLHRGCVSIWWKGLSAFTPALLSLGPRHAPQLGKKWAGITGSGLYSEPSKLWLCSRLCSLCPP